MKAVIDRFEGKWAVLLLGEEGAVVHVRRGGLPKGAKYGQWLRVELEVGEVVSAVINVEETEKVYKRIEEKLEKLRRGEHLK